METNSKTFAARQIEIIDNFYKFAGDVKVEDNSPMSLALWQDPVGSKRYVASFPAADGDGLQKQLGFITDFMKIQNFIRAEENYREDIYVNEDGAVANVTLVAVPGMQPELRVSIQMPKTESESELVKTYYNFPKK